MKYIYSNTKVVAVIELSSSAIKAIGYLPVMTVSKPEKIYDYKLNQVITIKNKWFDKKTQLVGIDVFKKDVLPEIVAIFQKVRRENSLQFIKIVATGYYRIAKNTKIVIKLIEGELQHLILKKKKYSNLKNEIKIHVLSARDESKYSYLSFINTLNKKERNTIKSLFKDKIGLHIDTGSATTEISVFLNNDFTKTVSILIELKELIALYEEEEKLHFLIENYHNEANRVLLKECLSNIHFIIKPIIEEKLKDIFTVPPKVDFCVATGVSLITGEKKDIAKSEIIKYSSFTDLINNSEERVIEFAFGSKINGIHSRDQYFNKLVKQYFKLIVLETVFIHFNIEEFYFNYANLRIGVYQELIKELRETYE